MELSWLPVGKCRLSGGGEGDGGVVRCTLAMRVLHLKSEPMAGLMHAAEEGDACKHRPCEEQGV